MNITQALYKARQETHTVSGCWYAGQCYHSNKDAVSARANDVILRAAHYITGADSGLIRDFVTQSMVEGYTTQRERLEWVIDHVLAF